MESSVNYDVNSQEFKAVNDQIAILNKEMFNAPAVNSRGFFGFFKKILAITVADAVGGMFGSLIGPGGTAAGAIMASGAAGIVPASRISMESRATINGPKVTLSSMNSADVALNNIVPIPLNRPTSVEDSIGYYHNMILMDLKANENKTDLNTDNMINQISSSVAKYYKCSFVDVKTELDKKRILYEKIAKGDFDGEKYQSVHELINDWKRTCPEMSSKLSTLEPVLEGIAQLDVTENDGTYLSRVLSIIERSNLDANSKQNLRNAFIVGNASYQLWNTQQ